ncbi:PKD domain-containing protein [Candidatus Woesearchaeota archaeon]|nr:PKD domain-containing protein [Candidatus Woesearchaeota archaeon]
MKMKNIIAIIISIVLVVQIAAISVGAEITDLPPMVTAVASPDAGQLPLAVAFFTTAADDNDQDSTLLYSWDFGDGSYAQGKNPVHIYTTEGTYYATVRVVDSANNVGSDTVTITVTKAQLYDLPPVVTAVASQDKGSAPLNVAFFATAVDNEDAESDLKYSWDFGDGSHAEGKNPVHIYTAPGNYMATVRVVDTANNIGSDTLSINVQDPLLNPNLPPAVTLNGPDRAYAGDVVQFTAIGTDPDEGDFLTYMYDFGDGGTAIEQNPVHTFMDEGVFTVRVTVTDGNGASTSDTRQIIITERPLTNIPPTAIAQAHPTEGTNPLVVSFVGIGFDPDGEIARYHWDFDDGTTSDSQNPIHTYTQLGTYIARLYVYDNNGAHDVDDVTIRVELAEQGADPLIAAIPNQVAVLNEEYEYQVVASDPFGEALTYSMTGAPEGVTINPISGMISGIPTELGDFPITATVTDDSDNSVSATYVLTVVEFLPEDRRTRNSDLSVDRIALTNGEVLPIGELLSASVLVTNDAVFNFEDVTIRVSVPELGITKSILIEDLRSNRDELRNLFIDIPGDARPGEYEVRITVSNDELRRVIHREITVVPKDFRFTA